MKSRSYSFIAYFFLLPIIQVIVFDQFNLGTQLIPHITLLFLIFYPTDSDQTFYLFIAFLYGLYQDILHSTMGLQAAACVTVAFLRPFIITSVFGKNHGYVNIRLQQTPLLALSAYCLNIVLIHHMVYYFLGVSSWFHYFGFYNSGFYNSGFYSSGFYIS